MTGMRTLSKSPGLLLAMAAVLLVPAPAPGAVARGRNASMLVSAEWLASRLHDPSLIILHVGSRTDYAAGHVPGARLVALADISITGETGLRLELPPVSALESAFRKLGISNTSRIIVYAGTDSVQSATRVWFTLDYLGLGKRTALLEGGLRAWRAGKRPITTEEPVVAPGRFTAHPAERVVTAEWLRAHLGDPAVRLLDARTSQFYSGGDAGGMPRAGHIPGARSVPFSSMFGEDGRLKPVADLRRIMNGSDGRTSPLTVSYCHIGQQATVLYFVARYLGMDVRLYDGSFQDWSRRPDFPVDTGVQ
jgi:thiosulfate/3-mercaptopyruvate sulfurtransferase